MILCGGPYRRSWNLEAYFHAEKNGAIFQTFKRKPAHQDKTNTQPAPQTHNLHQMKVRLKEKERFKSTTASENMTFHG